jgi:hypothetical protein
MSYMEKSSGKAMRSGEVWAVMRLAWLQPPHSIAGIGPVKWHGTLQHANDVFVVGNVQ